MRKVSIIIPAFNERHTIRPLLEAVRDFHFPEAEKEIIVVDDGSTDGTREILGEYVSDLTPIFHDTNQGKGSAIRTGLESATGDYVIVQDADLEYDPRDIREMYRTMQERELTVLYGSRRLAPNQRGRFVYYAGGILLSWLANILYGLRLTDEATCYKMFRTDFLKSLPLKCERFEFCPEVTALTALRGFDIAEIPISYRPRDRSQGKKISMRDGIEAISVLLRHRLR